MGIRSRIKSLLPIIGGDAPAPRPAATYNPPPRREPPAPEPPPRSADEVKADIDALVKAHPVVLFMKGSPNAPMCGFSAKVASILQGQGVLIESRDVLADPVLREAIKEYSDWPTLPQLYIGGEFVGGSDIVLEMDASGELEQALKAANAVGL
jgi:monothiol glutaredoxin